MKKIIFLFVCLVIGSAIGHEETQSHEYRVYDETTPAHVREFYRVNHENQTLDFVLNKKQEYLPPCHIRMGIWDAIKHLDTFVDESDPDLDLPQSYHCYQTAEAIRRDGHPRWMILVGFIHDLGKMLQLFDEPQWAIVGDTFPVGCAFSDKIVFPEFFGNNSDLKKSVLQTKLGIYQEGCGWENVHFSWGHDEYLYQIVKDYLPEEAGYIIRYHSFYPGHHEGEYQYLMNDYDRAMLSWVQLFQKYDLYSKDPEPLDVVALKPYYEELVAEFFPEVFLW